MIAPARPSTTAFRAAATLLKPEVGYFKPLGGLLKENDRLILNSIQLMAWILLLWFFFFLLCSSLLFLRRCVLCRCFQRTKLPYLVRRRVELSTKLSYLVRC